MSKFDAAISYLKVGQAIDKCDFNSAIRLLEAAAKVTEKDLAWFKAVIEDHIAEYTPFADFVCPGRAQKDRLMAVRDALLAALPDAEEPK